MPELPEVEITRRGIESYLIGETILYTIIRNSNLRWPVSNEIYKLNNELVLSVQRCAKYLLLELQDSWILIHLGMSGSLRILTRELIARKHDHIDLVISNGKVLRYTDPRRFGAWLWVKNLKECKLLSQLGPEPLSDEFNATYLKTKCMKKRIAIKPYLMDSRLLVGVGNIYASESLFEAGIHPSRLSSSLSNEECELLVKAIKMVLQRAIEHSGTTLKNFLQIDGKPGHFTQKLRVYGRKGKLCKICGITIVAEKHSQRMTYYCRQCQK